MMNFKPKKIVYIIYMDKLNIKFKFKMINVYMYSRKAHLI